MTLWEDYIEVNPEILVGKPTVKGTRLFVEFIMERLANGWTEEEIIDNYPSLDKMLYRRFTVMHTTSRSHLIFAS